MGGCLKDHFKRVNGQIFVQKVGLYFIEGKKKCA